MTKGQWEFLHSQKGCKVCSPLFSSRCSNPLRALWKSRFEPSFKELKGLLQLSNKMRALINDRGGDAAAVLILGAEDHHFSLEEQDWAPRCVAVVSTAILLCRRWLKKLQSPASCRLSLQRSGFIERLGLARLCHSQLNPITYRKINRIT
jgi:hypothetical protein